jgi:threonine synthase
MAGLARDGGLYVPREWPHFSTAEIRSMRGLAYPDLAIRVLTPFLGGEIAAPVFERLVREAYATFRHPAVCPLVQLDTSRFVLELFHGPTLAFKDVAMQVLSRDKDHILNERTSRATIDAFAGRERTDIFILFPHGKVSPVQQRQMTTSSAANVHALAVEGNFDDCQGLVKGMFNNHAFRDRVALSGVNSINWARIMAQIVYYFSSALSLGSPDRPVSRCTSGQTASCRNVA